MRKSAIIGALGAAMSYGAAAVATSVLEGTRHLEPRGGLANSGFYRSNYHANRTRKSRNDDPSYRKSIWPEGKVAKPGRMINGDQYYKG